MIPRIRGLFNSFKKVNGVASSLTTSSPTSSSSLSSSIPASSYKQQEEEYLQSDSELTDTFKAFLSTHTYYHINAHDFINFKYSLAPPSSQPSIADYVKLRHESDRILCLLGVKEPPQSLSTTSSQFKHHHQQHQQQESSTLTMENIDEEISNYYRQLTLIPYLEQQNTITNVLDYQIHRLFQHVHDTGGKNCYPPPLVTADQEKGSISPSKDNIYFSNTLESRLRRTLRIKQENIEGSVIDHPYDKFSLVIKKSSIDHGEAGYGVHVKGLVSPGTVLAIYPGDTYTASNMDHAAILENEYMMSRYDGTVIDGRSWLKKVDMSIYRSKYFSETGTSVSEEELLKYRNPFAIGQFINHPSEHKQNPNFPHANVIGIKYNFPQTFPDHLKPYIPHTSVTDTNFFRDKNIFAKSYVLIANRYIQDEELLLNYRYNPANPYPPWYFQPDILEAKRRWGKVNKFSLRPFFDRIN
ncbi:hypothetical protein DFA_09765 [Cavenderia fasciculata]|uniref:SET domain-containing protein n=1 Tax=Cavenderia fasciculata TaxID=261658 RepID=F4Q8J3_CACFS|nr:uncharacterized protein DFA_09765 [Cavenderia fasciculata]EGG16093.1 hypothetical protein DFA_09765 [Cavenderia fasciculata]|eukprot:XP_004352418.1 hypothetical protein DFA_09765 [Cavenderia fasciculata]